jgi:hypothetical protein
MKNVDPTKAFVEEVAQLVLANLLERIAQASKPIAYSTRRGHGPPGMSDRACKRVLPLVPGATTRGRWIVVSVAAFEAWERRDAAPPATPPAEPWTPAVAAREAGLRGTR